MIKILILFIYSPSDEYREMLEIQRKYAHKHSHINSYFVIYRKNQKENITIEDDMIFVKGEESKLNIFNTQKPLGTY